MLPTIIAHADWGSEARKRCVAEARLDESVYEIDVPSEVRSPRTLIGSLLGKAEGGAVLLGFDFPIGVPQAYAKAAGITDFVAFLRDLGTRPWDRFFSVAEAPGEISIYRPFYPMRPGNSRQWHLLGGFA